MAAVRRALKRSGSAGVLCAFALALAGCSTLQSLSGIPHAGYQSDGSYVLSAQEQKGNCRALQARSIGLQQQMRQLSLRALDQMQKVPNTVAAAWGRLFGSPGDGVPAIAEYNQARAESAALKVKLAQKGCAPRDTASITR